VKDEQKGIPDATRLENPLKHGATVNMSIRHTTSIFISISTRKMTHRILPDFHLFIKPCSPQGHLIIAAFVRVGYGHGRVGADVLS
jgi:hypothetical protein